MKQAVYIGYAQPSILSIVSRIVKSFMDWWQSDSHTFTALCATERGERFSHGDVVKAHLWLALILAIALMGGVA
jgi:hypothetical protein